MINNIISTVIGGLLVAAIVKGVPFLIKSIKQYGISGLKPYISRAFSVVIVCLFFLADNFSWPRGSYFLIAFLNLSVSSYSFVSKKDQPTRVDIITDLVIPLVILVGVSSDLNFKIRLNFSW